MTDQVQDPLAVPANQVSDFPLLKPDKIYHLAVRGVTVEDVDDPEAKDPKLMTIKLATTQDERSTNDEVLHSGFVIIKRVYLYEKGGRTFESIGRDLAGFIKAVEGKTSKTSARQLIDNPTMFDGKLVDVKIGIQKDKGGVYPDSNTVRFVPVS